MAADAFFVAFRIPNLFRDLVGEGATNAAVVPVLSEYKEKKGKGDFWPFVSIVFLLGLILLATITLLGMILAPLIVRLIVPGFAMEALPDKLNLTISLTRWMFPYLIFIGLTSYSMGLLYTFRSFWVPAFTPCLLNVAMITSAFFAASMDEPVYGLAAGVLVGGLLQLLVQVPPLLKIGMKFKMPKTLKHPGAAKIGRLLVPRMLGSGVYQLTVLIDTFCASLSHVVGAGGISAIYYANRIIQFPMGIFGVALASAVLPSLSGLANKKDLKSIKKTVRFSFESIFFVMWPTTVVLLLLSTPIIRILFQRGEFDIYSTDITSWALVFYSIGLFGFGGIKILVTAFHALQDTKTPVKVAALCLTINAILNFVLMGPLKIGGIALASSIAGTIDFLLLFYILRNKIGSFDSDLVECFCKILLASVITGFIELMSWRYVSFTSDVSFYGDLMKLVVFGGGGFVLYGIICYWLKIEQAQKLWKWMSSRTA